MVCPKNVLLIDDDEDDYKFFEIALNKVCESAELRYESSGNRALNSLMTDSYDLDIIFMDWIFPDCNGKELIINVRKMEPYSNVPIVIISDAIADVVLQEVSDLSSIVFVSKPSLMSDFVEKLKYIFSLEFKHLQNVNI